ANPRARLLLGLGQDGLPGGAFLALARRHFHCEPETAWTSWPEPPPAPGLARFLVRPESSTAVALWLGADGVVLPSPGERTRLVRLRDVTEKLRMSREVWAFHTAVSHKLRTPLAAMLPSLEYLSAPGSALAPDSVRDLAGAAFRGAERLDAAIE